MELRVKAIFDFRQDSEYNDEFPDRYHFPRRYYEEAKRAVGDWIIYRTTQRGSGYSAYIGTANVLQIESDPVNPNHYFARVSNHLEFPDPVFFRRENKSYWERNLNSLPSNAIGREIQGQSIRVISDSEFTAIVSQGIDKTLNPENVVVSGLDEQRPILEELSVADSLERNRRIAEFLAKKPIRDANFRLVVLGAYDNRCAVTGLRILNGGGRAEAQAAHIRPVAANGPDHPSNGIALSATCHWLFDRHLISLTNDYELLISKSFRSELKDMRLEEGQQIHVPDNKLLRPNPKYLEYHREMLHI